MTAPRTRRPLIGRAQELAALAELAGLDPSGQPATTVLVSGDAGVGKTRLIDELRDRAATVGWRVLVGHCLPLADGGLPYLPFSEMFGRLALDSPEQADALLDTAPAVARLMPGRRLLTTSQRGSDDHAPWVERGELFPAVHATLTQLSRDGPLLVVVEDVHWADQSTHELLSFLFTRRSAERLSVVVSYRSDDLHRRHPLRPVLAEWGRLPDVARLVLTPLPDGDVRSLVRALHQTPIPEGEVRRIVERAEGNAFFTEELVAAAERGVHVLPDDLADLLLVRLDQLDEPARQTVRAASAAGRRVSHELLTRVVDLPSETLDRALRAAVDGNVLVAVDADSYAFRHALLAEAVYDDLLPGERVRLHAAYTAALTAGGVDGTAAELARHARAAHDLATAIHASIEAGDEAMSVAGPDEAARHYETALELLSAGGGDGSEVDLVALVLRAADAAAAAGQVVRSLAMLEDHLIRLPVTTAPEQRATLLHALARTALLSETTVDILALTTEALQLVADAPATPLRAQVMSTHARANFNRHRDDDAGRWAREAVVLARRLGVPEVAADATTTLARLDERSGDPESALRSLRRSVEEARAADDISAELRGMFTLADLHFELGQLHEARRHYTATAERARTSGRPWAPFGVDARALAGMVAYVTGDWEAVFRISDVSGESPSALGEALLAAMRLAVHAGRGNGAAADQLPQLRHGWEREGMIAIFASTAAIDLHGDAGNLDAAMEAHADVVATLRRLWQPDFQAQIRLAGLLLGQIGREVPGAGALRRAELVTRAAELVDSASAVAERGQLHGRRPGPESVAWLARVRAEHARVRWLADVDPPPAHELLTAWEQAVHAFESFGHTFEIARSRTRLAAVLRALGRVSEAAARAVLAHEVAARLGAGPLLAELRLLDLVREPFGAKDSTLLGDLTPREREVLVLVARGRTNRAIASQLFISPKTASVHVSHIMAKLGASGRTEAVALARQRGLLVEDSSGPNAAS